MLVQVEDLRVLRLSERTEVGLDLAQRFSRIFGPLICPGPPLHPIPGQDAMDRAASAEYRSHGGRAQEIQWSVRMLFLQGLDCRQRLNEVSQPGQLYQ